MGAVALLLLGSRPAHADPNGFNGAYEDDVPIVVPPYHGIDPKLSLHYNSSGGNGPLGVGWALSGFSVIERTSPGGGAPRYDNTDIFMLDGRELVPCVSGSISPSCNTGGTHSTKIENYSRIAYDGTNWTITQKDGTKASFTPIFQVNPGGVWKTWKWGISSLADSSGNTVSYAWGVNQWNTCCWEYPSSISYNGTTITLYWEQRSDVETRANGVAFASYYGRVKTIDVVTSGSRVRSYKLWYTNTGVTGRSLLAKLWQYGKDATLDSTGTVTGGTSMPPMVFTQTTGALQLQARGYSTSQFGKATGWPSDQYRRRYPMDVNGDGKMDLVLGPNSSGSFYVMLSNGSGFTDQGSPWLTRSSYAAWQNDTNGRRYAMDVNGDGMTDLVLGPNQDGSFFVLLSTGHSFTDNNGLPVFTNPDLAKFQSDTNGCKYPMDVNGDGKMDLVLGPDASGNFYVLISTGTSFTYAGPLPTKYGTWASDASHRRYPMDVNGDGKMDLVIGPEAVTGNWYVLRSTGTSFVDDDAWIRGSQYAGWNSDTNVRRYPMDVNGDGKMDMVLGPDGSGNWYVMLSNGTAFIDQGSSWTPPGGAFGSLQTDSNGRRYPMDVNGDGKSDMLLGPVDSSGNWFVLRSTGSSFVLDNNGQPWVNTSAYGDWSADTFGRRYQMDVDGDGKLDMVLGPDDNGRWYLLTPPSGAADLVARIDNGLGGYTTMSYTPSSSWPNYNNPPVSPTVSSMTVADGRGNASLTTYSYSGGKWDWVGRQSLGYGSSKRALPCLSYESLCPYEITTFQQDYASFSKPQRIVRYNGANAILVDKSYVYTVNTGAPPYQSLETQAWVYVYDGSGNYCTGTWPGSPGTGTTCPYGARSVVTRAYDNYNASTQQWNAGYGNIVTENTYGNYDVAGDEVTVQYSYHPNTSAFITGKQAVVATYAGIGTSGALLSEGLFVYDNASSWSTAPVAGKPTKSYKWLNTTNAFVVKTATYDPYGNVTSETDEANAITSYTLDPTYHQYVTKTTNALNQSSTATWDPLCGARTQTTDPNGQTVTMTYDNLCRLTYTSYPLGAFEQRQYVNVGDPNNGYVEVDTPAADGSGNQWARTYYDGLGRTYMTAHKGPAGIAAISQNTKFNARGLVEQVSAPYYTGEAPQYETKTYDNSDRLAKVTHGDGSYLSKSYGFCNGWGCTTTTDEVGHAQRDTTDTAGRPKWHDEWFGSTVQTRTFTYDQRGNLSQVTDGAGNGWLYTVDSLGRKLASTDPDAGSWTYAYDNAGRLTSQTDALNQTTTFTYDPLGRRTQKVARAGTSQAVTSTWTYDQPASGYYNVGRLTTESNPSATSTVAYDALGRTVSSSRTIGGTIYTTGVAYDAGGRVLWTQYPDGTSVGTATSPLKYDGAGRLYSIPGFVNSVSYDGRGNPTTRVNANGTTTTKTYSTNRFWLTGISTSTASATIQNLAYSRDAEGKIMQVTSPFAYEGWGYGYDQHRLTSATNLTSSAYSQTFSYNTIGNITYNSWIGNFSYPPAGSARPHAVTQAGSTTYTYDANGNMLSGSGNFVWDGDSHAINIDGVAFAYDADGARVQKVFNATTTNYVSDDYEVTNGVTTKYIEFAGEPVARCVGVTCYWLHADVNGSIQAETNASGVEVQRQKYMPFGQRLQTTTSLVESRGYTAQRQDETGLFYLHARYYDPFVGRFDSPDPTVPSSASVGLNRYAYAGNDPVDHTDTNGLSWVRHLYGPVDLVAFASMPLASTLGLAGAVSAAHDGLDKLGAGIEYLAGKTGGIPVIGGVVVSVLATNEFTGAAWAIHDAKGWARPAAKGAIFDAAVILTVMTDGLPWYELIPANAGIGFGEGFGTAKVSGEANGSALRAGVEGAIVSAGASVLSWSAENLAGKGLHDSAWTADPDAADPDAEMMQTYNSAEAAAKRHIIRDQAGMAGSEGYFVGSTSLKDWVDGTGAYGGFGRWVADNIPYANFAGMVEAGGGTIAFVYAQPLVPFLIQEDPHPIADVFNLFTNL